MDNINVFYVGDLQIIENNSIFFRFLKNVIYSAKLNPDNEGYIIDGRVFNKDLFITINEYRSKKIESILN